MVMRLVFAQIAFCVLLIAGSLPAKAADCVEILDEDADKYRELVECLKILNKEVAELQTELGQITKSRNLVEELQNLLRQADSQTTAASLEAKKAVDVVLHASKTAEEASGIADKAKSQLQGYQTQLEESAETVDLISRAEDALQLLSDGAIQQGIADRVAPIPKHAVLAYDFDLPANLDPDGDKCPNGWQRLDGAMGRMIIGAGDGPGLSDRPYRKPGGEEEVTLMIEEMPSHDHGQGDTHQAFLAHRESGPLSSGHGGGHTGFGWSGIEDEGGDEDGNTLPHNNMPPFVALYFCKKS